MNGRLVVSVGPPGSGKSTWLHDRYSPEAIVSLDDLRLALTGDPCDQGASSEAVEIRRLIFAGRLRRSLTAVADATNVIREHRAELLEQGRELDARVDAVLFLTPLDVCLARNAERPGPVDGQAWGRRVPEDVIRAMHAALPTAALLTAEGFDQVTEVSR